MPVIHVRGGAADRASAASVLLDVARAVAASVPCGVEGVWCTFTEVAVATLGERVVADEGRIVYVDLWMRERQDAGASGRALEAACLAVAAGFGVPTEDVWGTLRPVEPGRVFAGGAVVR
jgi:hypothetical protein